MSIATPRWRPASSCSGAPVLPSSATFCASLPAQHVFDSVSSCWYGSLQRLCTRRRWVLTFTIFLSPSLFQIYVQSGPSSVGASSQKSRRASGLTSSLPRCTINTGCKFSLIRWVRPGQAAQTKLAPHFPPHRLFITRTAAVFAAWRENRLKSIRMEAKFEVRLLLGVCSPSMCNTHFLDFPTTSSSQQTHTGGTSSGRRSPHCASTTGMLLTCARLWIGISRHHMLAIFGLCLIAGGTRFIISALCCVALEKIFSLASHPLHFSLTFSFSLSLSPPPTTF